MMKAEELISYFVDFRNRYKPVFERLAPLLASAPIWIIFILGLWFIVLRGLGPHWEFVPGDLGDGRFNNYILEHFFLWISGKVPASSYWDAPFFYPYLRATAFSDNLFGAAPLYAVFRWVGLDRETAFQYWYFSGFIFNYAAAVYALSRAHLKPVAVGIGAFFFTFGMPLLSAAGHFQLFYRFGVPLACFLLLEFFSQPKLTRFAAMAFWLVWQFYLSIYTGFFLVMLLVLLAFLAPFFEAGFSFQKFFYQWPIKLKQAWFQANASDRIFSLFLMGAAGFCFFMLAWPYYKISIQYSLVRNWFEISSMLPTPKSFLIADSSIIWASISAQVQGVVMRHEHQLFPGIAIVVMLAIGLGVRFKSKNSRISWLYFGAMILLILGTLNLGGYSIYWLIWRIPGVNSIRAVTRMQVVWMWPLAFFAAWVIDGILEQALQKKRWLYLVVLLLTVLLISESVFFVQIYYLKADSVSRIAALENQLPETLPKNPILVAANSKDMPKYVTQMDAMIAAQELGWPTINGYSGNAPPSYRFPKTCDQIRDEIKTYVRVSRMEKEAGLSFYQATINRIVPIGFQDCRSNWREEMP